MKQPVALRISPDRHYVSYVVQQANWDENAFDTQIWMADAVSGDCYQLTSGKKSSGNPRWAPDSKRLAFTSDRDGKPQIYVMSVRGGEAAQLTSEENGVEDFDWSPDGRTIAFLAKPADPKATKDRKDKYGDYEVIGSDYTMQHLFLIAVPEVVPSDPKGRPKAEALTSGNQFTIGDFAWSPDSRRIAFSAARDPDLGSQDTTDIYVVNVADKLVKPLVTTRGPDRHPVWSPDGQRIAFTTANAQEFFFYANARIAVVPAEGGKPRIMTENFDEDPDLVAWGDDGIYFTARQKTNTHLFRLNPETANIERISAPEQTQINAVAFTKDCRTVALSAAAPNRFSEIYLASVDHFTPRQLTDFQSQWKPFRLATREVIQWKSSDGTTIEGILIKPADYNSTRKYPLLVVIHGGPTGVDTPARTADRTYPVEEFAAKGALILKPNYRGSAGYGEKFRSLNVRNLGLGDYADVITGVDSLIAKGLVDKDRIGAMGWSQGGYISAFITTYSDRFKAVSVGAGISDWMTYYVNTDIHPFTRQYLKATPWDDPEVYRKTSPITYVKNAKTPTLIQHGDQDKRVPPPNAFELYQALRDRGVPCKLILYKGFGHPINKPKQQHAVMQHNYEWFSQYIWGEHPQPDLAAAGN